jgi:hypothetical protein
MQNARKGGETDGGGLVRERAGGLRLLGLGIAGVVLILWPDPGLRVVISVGVLLAIYLATLWMLASDSESAAGLRSRLGDSLGASRDLPVQQGGFVGWMATHTGILRLLGIVIAGLLVLFVWDLSLGGFVLIAAALLLYLAVIEWASNAARQPPDSTDSPDSSGSPDSADSLN